MRPLSNIQAWDLDAEDVPWRSLGIASGRVPARRAPLALPVAVARVGPITTRPSSQGRFTNGLTPEHAMMEPYAVVQSPGGVVPLRERTVWSPYA